MTPFLAVREEQISPLLGEERGVNKCGKQRSVGGNGESVVLEAEEMSESE